MGLIDGALGMLLGRGGGPAKKILGAVIGMVGGGGLNKILGAFRDKGMSEQADSWVSTGENQPLTADQVRQALSPEEIKQIADEAGISVEEAEQRIAEALPEVVNQATPDGSLPDDATLEEQVAAARRELDG